MLCGVRFRGFRKYSRFSTNTEHSRASWDAKNLNHSHHAHAWVCLWVFAQLEPLEYTMEYLLALRFVQFNAHAQRSSSESVSEERIKKNSRRRIFGASWRGRLVAFCWLLSLSLTRTRSNGRMFGALNSLCIKSQPKRVKSFAFSLASDECNFPLNRSSFVHFNLTRSYSRWEKKKVCEWHKWCWRNLQLKKKNSVQSAPEENVSSSHRLCTRPTPISTH